MKLEGKVAIVTGGGRGIGRGIARVYAREGAKVTVAARTQEQIDAVVAEIEAEGGTAVAVQTDMASTPDVERMVAVTVERFGRLDVLVNNAGIGWWGRNIDDDMEAAYDELMAVNLRGVWMATHYAVPHMKAVGGGSIIGISSVHAWATFPSGSAYAASKGGMVAGTRGLAVELAPFMIRVNTISPGAIEIGDPGDRIAQRFGEEYRAEFIERFAEMVQARKHTAQPMPVVGKPEDIAYCALYLASDESRFVTGTNITVDGGMTAKLSHGAELSAELREKESEMRAWYKQLLEAEEQDES